MSLALATRNFDMSGPHATSLLREAASRDLPPLVARIDQEGFYPERFLRDLGGMGAYLHPQIQTKDPNEGVRNALVSIADVGEHCLSTAFCVWCQNALTWYLRCTDNGELKSELSDLVASGAILGGTGLSNPMKTFFGIEKMKLKGKRVDGGYVVRGTLPWVSNLGADHMFGIVFEREDGRPTMAVLPCSAEGVKLADGGTFLALDGSGTYGIQIRDAFVADKHVLADPAEAYVKRIRGGFVLMQVGMGLGLARGCIRLIRETEASLGHVNRYLDVQADDLEARASSLEERAFYLSDNAYDADRDAWRGIVEARLEASELALAAAHNAMLHSGARGYVATGEAQRRLREAYFVAIVTPAIKQLKKMLADMPLS